MKMFMKNQIDSIMIIDNTYKDWPSPTKLHNSEPVDVNDLLLFGLNEHSPAGKASKGFQQ